MSHHIKDVRSKVEAAYRRRFYPKGKVHVSIDGDAARYALVTDEESGRKVKYDLTAWRVRYLETVRHGA